MSDVTFYRSSEKPYGVFSNLFRREMVFEGRVFPTAEHAYQFGKPRKDVVRRWLMDAPSPSLLAMAAHGLYAWDVAPGWSAARRARMAVVVAAKFAQHQDLAKVLISTGDARIVETPSTDSAVNRRWGEVNGLGENWLGLILMDVRAALEDSGERACQWCGTPGYADDPFCLYCGAQDGKDGDPRASIREASE